MTARRGSLLKPGIAAGDDIAFTGDNSFTGEILFVPPVGKPVTIKASMGETGRIFEIQDSGGVFKAGTAFNGHQFATVYCFENDAQVITRSGANHALKAGSGGDAQLITDFGTIAFKGATGQLNIPFAVVMDEAATGPSLGATVGGYWVLNSVPTTPQFTDDTSVDHALAMLDVAQTWTAAQAFDLEVKALQYATTNNGTVLLENGVNTRLRSDAGDVEFQTTFGFVAFKAANGFFNIPVALLINETSVGPDLGATKGGYWVLDDAPTTPQFTDDTSVDHPLAMTNVATTWTQDHIFQGNVTIQGDTIQATSETLLADNHILLNAGYTSDPAQTCGLIGLNDPTTTADTVATDGFTAGVAAVSNATVITTGTATFAASDIVQITGANDPANNGIYEVLSHVGTTLTIRGVGLTARVEDFTQNNFVTDATVAGAITKSNVAVHRCGLDGLYETAQGSVTGFGFVDYALLAGQLGGAATAPDVRGIRTTTGPTLLTFGAIADGEFLKRVGATVIGAASVAGALQYAELSDSTDQNPSVTTPVPITFNKNNEIEGITHSTSTDTDEITVNEDGVYKIVAEPQVGKTSGATLVEFSMFLQINRADGGFIDEPDTTIKYGIKDSDLTAVSIFNRSFDLDSGDKMRLMQRVTVSTVGMGLKATAAEVGPPTVPATPSIICSVTKVGPGV